jgi:hypothetical protein
MRQIKIVCQLGLLITTLCCSVPSYAYVKKVNLLPLSSFGVMQSYAYVKKDFDFDVDNAALDVVGFGSLNALSEHVSKNYGDATMVFRYGILMTNAWYDATAAYHPTAVGVYSHLGRRPAIEATNRNINIAVFYASLRILNSFMPTYEQTWRELLINVGLDPDDNSTDLTSPIGLGNVAGNNVVAGRFNDGMNQAGNQGHEYNPMPYSDYTGYKPVNTSYELLDPSHWQPDIQRKGLGLYKIQQFVTPQLALTEPYSYDDPKQIKMPPPSNSNFHNSRAYRKQVDEVLNISANLTDEQKIKAELFDDKFRSLSFSVSTNTLVRNLSLLEFIQFELLVNMAGFDSSIFVWQEKYRYDAVRPFSAIHKLYKNKLVKAWGGPEMGAVNLLGNDWQSYIEEADHPEYPSASACFCYSNAQAARRFFGDDNMVYNLAIGAGESRIEPGITPAKDTMISYNTWTKFAEECGQSRIWAGVHFQAAVDESAKVCPIFGDLAYKYMSSLIDGSAVLRTPSKGRSVNTLPTLFQYQKVTPTIMSNGKSKVEH